MVVQHNMQALNANRMLGVTTNAQAKSTEKLSSGYKINRAADDAAGLTISEKMRKQIRGLDQASTNAEDGVSAVQTAEGALSEVHDMLQRMNELATQAANGTYSDSDRQAIQDEIDQLVTEIDRVAETTKFNETYLLKGNGTTTTKTIAAHDAGLDGTLVDNEDGTSTFTAEKLETGSTVSIGGTEYTIVESSNTSDYSVVPSSFSNGDVLVQDGKTYTYVTAGETTPAGQTVATGKAGWYADDNTTSDTPNSVTAEAGDTYTSATTGKTTTLVGDTTTYTLASATTQGSAQTWAEGDTIVRDGKTYTYDAVNTTWVDEDDIKVSLTAKAGDTYTIKSTGLTAQIDNGGISTVENIQAQIKATTAGTVKIASSIDGNAKEYTIGTSTKEDGTAYTADDIAALVSEGAYVTIGSSTYYAVPKASDDATDITLQDAYSKMAEELQKASSIGTDDAAVVTNNGDGSFDIKQGTVSVKEGLSFNLHVGADADMTNKISVSIDAMSAAGLGIKGINVMDDTGNDATYAIDAIADALAVVSAQRSSLGAIQNRLEHTISNLDNVVENTTSAESRIRDTDMAEEMVTYSKNSILQQAGQSMLAQANSANQGVLSLLQ